MWKDGEKKMSKMHIKDVIILCIFTEISLIVYLPS